MPENMTTNEALTEALDAHRLISLAGARLDEVEASGRGDEGLMKTILPARQQLEDQLQEAIGQLNVRLSVELDGGDAGARRTQGPSLRAKACSWGFLYVEENRAFRIGERINYFGEMDGRLIGGNHECAVFVRDDGQVRVGGWEEIRGGTGNPDPEAFPETQAPSDYEEVDFLVALVELMQMAQDETPMPRLHHRPETARFWRVVQGVTRDACFACWPQGAPATAGTADEKG
ncbi:MAG: hypothetical protein ACLFV3_10405 [Phycisphaeraceae bacterium]